MSLAKVTVNQLNGGLGRLPRPTDGVAALVISARSAASGLALNTTATVFTLEDAQALGITPEFDRETDMSGDEQRVWARVRDFYREAGAGAKLYLRLVAAATTQTQMLSGAGAVYEVLRAAQGDVKLVATARGFAVGTVSAGLDADVYTAIAAAKALRANEVGEYRYCQFLIEGRQFSGTIPNLTDLRAPDGPKANRVSVVVGCDRRERFALANAPVASAGSAAVGLLLGHLARVQVHRNPGRVLDGPAVGVLEAALSGGQQLPTYTEAQLGTLDGKGFLFLRQHTGLNGYFWNEGYTATDNTDDYGRIERGRVMDKASAITRTVYVQNLLDNVQIDAASGQIDTATIKAYQSSVESAIERQMVAAGELVAVAVTVDPDQNVLATDQIETEVALTPSGLARDIVAMLAYKNPLLAA